MNKQLVPDNRELRKFGLGLAVILGLIGGFLVWRGRASGPYFLAVAGAALALAAAWPTGLKPAYRFMMWLAAKLAWLNTRIILTLVFYLVFTPVALVLRLIGKDLLDARIKSGRDTYWVDWEKGDFDKDSYRHQF
ncbi:MAG: SxtJ family membrane protein [Thermodesulfobacteriota bacterium]